MPDGLPARGNVGGRTARRRNFARSRDGPVSTPRGLPVSVVRRSEMGPHNGRSLSLNKSQIIQMNDLNDLVFTLLWLIKIRALRQIKNVLGGHSMKSVNQTIEHALLEHAASISHLADEATTRIAKIRLIRLTFAIYDVVNVHAAKSRRPTSGTWLASEE
jgi:hypothetical protein